MSASNEDSRLKSSRRGSLESARRAIAWWSDKRRRRAGDVYHPVTSDFLCRGCLRFTRWVDGGGGADDPTDYACNWCANTIVRLKEKAAA